MSDDLSAMLAYAVAGVCGALFLGPSTYAELRRRRRSLPARPRTDARVLAVGALTAVLLVVGAKALVALLAVLVRTFGPKVRMGTPSREHFMQLAPPSPAALPPQAPPWPSACVLPCSVGLVQPIPRSALEPLRNNGPVKVGGVAWLLFPWAWVNQDCPPLPSPAPPVSLLL